MSEHVLLRMPRPRRIARPPVGTVVLAVIVAACALAPLICRYGPTDIDPANAFAGASGEHWLGTDELGRDMFSRMLYGGRLSLLVAFGGTAVAFLAGTTWGVLAAGRGGLAGEILMRSADVAMAIPQLLF